MWTHTTQKTPTYCPRHFLSFVIQAARKGETVNIWELSFPLSVNILNNMTHRSK